jgi:hypothetical protein
MFIGASPGGTGGGIKTTTFAILMGATRSTLEGRDEVVIQRRQIPDTVVLRAVGVTLASALFVILMALLLGIGPTTAGEPTRTSFNFLEKLFTCMSAFGTVGLDWDRDGRMEMFVATGHVLGPRVQPYQMQPQLLWQAANGTFVDVSDDVGGAYFSGKWLGRAAAAADYDNDGDLDLAVSHNISPVALLRDDTAAPGRFLGLDLRTPSRIPPVGGRVEVTCDGRKTTPVDGCIVDKNRSFCGG